MKRCAGCHIEKELFEFSKNKRSPDGLQDRCKDCCKQYREDNKKKNQVTDFSNVSVLDCHKCGEIKSISEFSPKNNAPRGFDYWCKSCRRLYAHQYRDENIEEARQYTNDRRATRVQWCQELKSNIPCADCGQIYEPYCMDYDHVPERGEKIKSVSRMVMDNTSKKAILEEIKKCDLVCVLCHNKRTFDRFNQVLGIERKYKSNQQRNIEIINTFKAQPCVICGLQYQAYNMQVDHVDIAGKLYDVCNLKNFKVDTLLIELAKCQVLCALCHRRQSIIDQKDGKYARTG